MAVRRTAGAVPAKPTRRDVRPSTTLEQPAHVRIFISYSHRDDASRERLDVHMAQLKREGVSVFFDGHMIPGTELDPRIKRELKQADIFVALASPAYLNSRYCFEIEYGYAFRKAQRGQVHLVVALIEECQWRHTRMSRYKLLPRDGKPVSKWRPYGEAFEDIVNGLRGVVKTVKAERVRDWQTRKSKVPRSAKLSSISKSPSKSRQIVSAGQSKAAASPPLPIKRTPPAGKPVARSSQSRPRARPK